MPVKPSTGAEKIRQPKRPKSNLNQAHGKPSINITSLIVHEPGIRANKRDLPPFWSVREHGQPFNDERLAAGCGQTTFSAVSMSGTFFRATASEPLSEAEREFLITRLTPYQRIHALHQCLDKDQHTACKDWIPWPLAILNRETLVAEREGRKARPPKYEMSDWNGGQAQRDMLMRLAIAEVGLEYMMRRHLKFMSDRACNAARAPSALEKDILRQAFWRVDPQRTGTVSIQQFLQVWQNVLRLMEYEDSWVKSKDVKGKVQHKQILKPIRTVLLDRNMAAALFVKYGFDKDGLMPYVVYINALCETPARLLGHEIVLKKKERGKNGLEDDLDIAMCLGNAKIEYRYCKAGVFPPGEFTAQMGKRSFKPPKAHMWLEHVYGYAGMLEYTRQSNIFYTYNTGKPLNPATQKAVARSLLAAQGAAEGTALRVEQLKRTEFVYYTGSVGVVFDKEKYDAGLPCQRFFFGHNNDIQCLSIHPNRRYCTIKMYCSNTYSIMEGEVLSDAWLGNFPFDLDNWKAACVSGGQGSTGHGNEYDAVQAILEASRQPLNLDRPLFEYDNSTEWWCQQPPLPAPSPGSEVRADDADGMYMSMRGVKREEGFPQPGASEDKLRLPHLEQSFPGCAGEVVWIANEEGRFIGTPASFGTEHIENVHGGVRALSLRKRADGGLDVLSGGADGCVQVRKLEEVSGAKPDGTPAKGIKLSKPEAEFRLATPGTGLRKEEDPLVVALDCHASLDREFLAGTDGCDIWEVDADPRIIVEGHEQDLDEVAAHAESPYTFATACQSGKLRVWDSRRRDVVKSADLGYELCGIAYSQEPLPFLDEGKRGKLYEGYHLAVSGQLGELTVMRSDTLQPLVHRQDVASKQAIPEMKYSPVGGPRLLAAACSDANIYIYRADKNYQLLCKCVGHSSCVKHVDWSLPVLLPGTPMDGRFALQSCDATGSLLYWDPCTGKKLPYNMRDTEWHTWTMPVGFDVMGIWPDCSDGTDINAVDRPRLGAPIYDPYEAAYEGSTEAALHYSERDSADGISGASYLVTADDFATVKLFNYPVVADDAPYKAFRGHASHVTSVRFLSDDRVIVSVGGHDRGIYQWRTCGIASGLPPLPAIYSMLAECEAKGGNQTEASKVLREQVWERLHSRARAFRSYERLKLFAMRVAVEEKRVNSLASAKPQPKLPEQMVWAKVPGSSNQYGPVSRSKLAGAEARSPSVRTPALLVALERVVVLEEQVQVGGVCDVFRVQYPP
ncbi:hypothetical protein VOLCADRAFT_90304 [Volvox carteri f. nagariensis]|uniref:EML-like second beta-propeller domain-containing protein n=1 Tax=Volvox carteri f. nagariensis TaxID=3068 RepID=D8TU09_VOLCA|nr:uncharacterized protein VOLCADRAFT_90304 [Volvox carteri f. nagariensis]EFJ49062.1 hypothetical protein VOLCADRAFT_90304 [Volvox carteri f. nagariensis]|eukprot:XP_002949959.1 hypothetical protein VOLCADRAFT_90304 [Volvox carteri f. nagariensis]